MSPQTALARRAEDPDAPIMARCEALKQLAHPPLSLLRRLLVETAKRAKPVPAKLKAIAALKYAHEVQLRKIGPAWKQRRTDDGPANALGI
jgi:hypothetical protein